MASVQLFSSSLLLFTRPPPQLSAALGTAVVANLQQPFCMTLGGRFFFKNRYWKRGPPDRCRPHAHPTLSPVAMTLGRLQPSWPRVAVPFHNPPWHRQDSESSNDGVADGIGLASRRSSASESCRGGWVVVGGGKAVTALRDRVMSRAGCRHKQVAIAFPF